MSHKTNFKIKVYSRAVVFNLKYDSVCYRLRSAPFIRIHIDSTICDLYIGKSFKTLFTHTLNHRNFSFDILFTSLKF